MAAKRATAKPRSGQASKGRAAGNGLPGWVWGLSGLAVGLFIAFLVHLEGSRPAGRGASDPIGDLLAPREESAPADGGTGTADTTGTAADDGGPRFEFYKLLPEQEVEVPRRRETARDEGGSGSAEAPAPDATAGRQPAADGRYLLQAGSFRSYEDADRLKASLALLGVEARIQEVELPGGEIWHRVRIGPFSDRDEINRVRERLARNNVEAILLRAGG